MPHPRHQLDLLWLPTEPDRAAPPLTASALQELGWASARGLAGPRAEALVPGGYAAIRVERRGRVDVWGNQQGGYRVVCPVTHDNLVPVYMEAMRSFRAGGPRSLGCPRCGQVHALEALTFSPPAAFSEWALVLRDVATARPAEGAEAEVAALFGSMRWLLRRSA